MSSYDITGFLRTAFRPSAYCVPSYPHPLKTAHLKGGFTLINAVRNLHHINVYNQGGIDHCHGSMPQYLYNTNAYVASAILKSDTLDFLFLSRCCKIYKLCIYKRKIHNLFIDSLNELLWTWFHIGMQFRAHHIFFLI